MGAPIFAPHVYLVARALSLLRADDPTTSQPVTLQQAAESQAYQRNYQGVGLLVGAVTLVTPGSAGGAAARGESGGCILYGEAL
ncbi:MAG: hypothetical protein IT374_08330 [Polyangiaceae bacterium]|nr:hypothetical protein [Polyangiaceae bacterium]